MTSQRSSDRILEYRIQSTDVKIRLNKKIYMPSAASISLARNLRKVEGARVLDLGTGSGFLAILASKLGAREVVATDISERALRDARKNAILNMVENIDFRLGSLYEPVKGEHFDLIVCNPPMTPSKIQLQRYTWGGADGRIVLDKVISEAPEHLREGGRLLIPVISLVGVGRTFRLMREVGLKPRAIDYVVHPFGKTLRKLLGYLSGLPDAEYVYDEFGRPCWRLIVFEAVKGG
ncbi:MAG: methyltransferase [Thaumarchaeota archaeon]|nr:methyltransferase [Nitrososphaerota archaeon]